MNVGPTILEQFPALARACEQHSMYITVTKRGAAWVAVRGEQAYAGYSIAAALAEMNDSLADSLNDPSLKANA
jgi:malate/lactate dehydrogenase